MAEFNEALLKQATELPAVVRMGTSSWKYPGWKGGLYRREYRSKRDFEQRCLEEYGAHPWFRAVGLDATFYAPPRSASLDRYAAQLPAHIQWVSKVWERITIPRFARQPRYGELAGKLNPDYLDAGLFRSSFLAPYDRPGVRERTGPFVLQFQRQGRSGRELAEFLERLDAFLGALPGGFRYATEVRTAELLCADYFAVLNRHGATHCFNHWTHMPPLIEQMRAAAAAGGLQADFYVSRLLTPLQLSYAEAVARFEPYDVLQQPQTQMRRDVVRLASRAIAREAEAFILVNNRLEGNAPATIAAIGQMIVGAAQANS
ncbi:MAG: hypothetical protein CMP23_15505 [Rickettsiales bacterium]|nr:hypothetical protein [Rickettsiales bacterium]|tara:strand:+ start:327 stop:1277 length:951 start_codon:yes stop_codon:yes gene_type:complete